LNNNEEKKYKIYPGDIINTTDTSPDYDVYKCEDGAYPIQNKLIEGYEYDLTIENNYIIDIKQITKIENKYTPPIKNTPGLKTLKNFISTAFQPLGTTLYVFGGGWDFQDLGTSNEGMTIGISPNWVKFYDDHDVNYTYKDTNKSASYYPFEGYNEYYYAGLDCSGYVGWTIYNNLYSESLKEKGFVTGSTNIAKTMADKKYGTWMHTVKGSNSTNPNYTLLVQELKVGDIISTDGHVMMCLGKCSDNSFIIMHSTPSDSIVGQPGGGVQLSAVNLKEDGSKNCEAYTLCEEYMKKYFKKWTDRYNVIVVKLSKVFNFPDNKPNTGIFHWDLNNGVIKDPDKYASKSAKEILIDLFQVNEGSPENGSYIYLIIFIIFLLVIIVISVIIVIVTKKKRALENNNKSDKELYLTREENSQ
jgi:hypothetical protein